MNDIDINLQEVNEKENHNERGKKNNSVGIGQNGPHTPANRDDAVMVSGDRPKKRKDLISFAFF